MRYINDLHLIYKIFFQRLKKGKLTDFLVVFFFESCHTLGLSLMAFVVLPNLDAVKGAMLSNCVCFIPGVFG